MGAKVAKCEKCQRDATRKYKVIAPETEYNNLVDQFLSGYNTVSYRNNSEETFENGQWTKQTDVKEAEAIIYRCGLHHLQEDALRAAGYEIEILGENRTFNVK